MSGNLVENVETPPAEGYTTEDGFRIVHYENSVGVSDLFGNEVPLSNTEWARLNLMPGKLNQRIYDEIRLSIPGHEGVNKHGVVYRVEKIGKQPIKVRFLVFTKRGGVKTMNTLLVPSIEFLQKYPGVDNITAEKLWTKQQPHSITDEEYIRYHKMVGARNTQHEVEYQIGQVDVTPAPENALDLLV